MLFFFGKSKLHQKQAEKVIKRSQQNKRKTKEKKNQKLVLKINKTLERLPKIKGPNHNINETDQFP